MKNIIFKKQVDIYSFNYKVIFDKETYFNYTNKEEFEFGGVCYFNYEDNDFVICIPVDEDNNINTQVLVHECYHMTDILMDCVGLEHKTNSSNEHIAYLLDYITAQVLECLEIYQKIKK